MVGNLCVINIVVIEPWEEVEHFRKILLVPKGAILLESHKGNIGDLSLRFLCDPSQENEERLFKLVPFGLDLNLQKGYPSFIRSFLDTSGIERFLFEIHNEL